MGKDKESVIQTLESELEKCNLELEKIMSEKIESDMKATTLNESISRLESLLKEKEEALNEHRQVEDLLNESLELEKKSSEMTKKEKEDLEEEVVALKGSFSPKVKKATLQQKLEIECLKSELERTKLKLKDAQDSSIRVHEELFEEHEEMLESLKSLPSKKRKRLIEDIYQESKKRKEEVDESDLLSESIDDGIFEDPKEDIAVDTTLTVTERNDAAFVLEPVDQEEDAVIQETVHTEIEVPAIAETMLASTEEIANTEDLLSLATRESFDEETLLTSTPSATKQANILFASWHNDEASSLQQTQIPDFSSQPIYQESNLEDLFDSYA